MNIIGILTLPSGKLTAVFGENDPQQAAVEGILIHPHC